MHFSSNKVRLTKCNPAIKNLGLYPMGKSEVEDIFCP